MENVHILSSLTGTDKIVVGEEFINKKFVPHKNYSILRKFVKNHMDKGEEQILSNVNRKQVVNTGTNVLEEDETSKNIKGNMYNPNIQDKYVRS